jgi:hypothetical protein
MRATNPSSCIEDSWRGVVKRQTQVYVTILVKLSGHPPCPARDLEDGALLRSARRTIAQTNLHEHRGCDSPPQARCSGWTEAGYEGEKLAITGTSLLCSPSCSSGLIHELLVIFHNLDSSAHHHASLIEARVVADKANTDVTLVVAAHSACCS